MIIARNANWKHYAVASAFAVPFALKPTSKFAAFAGRSTINLGMSTISWAARAAGRSTVAAATTSFVRGGTFSPARLAGSVTAGYVLGSGTLLGISQAVWGDSGFDDALDFIKDPFDMKKVEVVGSALKQTLWDSWSF